MLPVTLHFAPATCARVAFTALEETGVAFSVRTIAFVRGDHRSPEYLAINPKGKVPALEIDGLCLTENVAILDYLANRFPEAGLLPVADSPAVRAQRLADLAFCAATLHPLVTRIRMSPAIAGPKAARAVYEAATKAMMPNFALIEARLARQPWWYGEQWSVMDAYLNWVFFRVEGARFDTSAYPAFQRHNAAHTARDASQRMLAREAEINAQLSAQQLLFTPPDPRDYE
jgi:glutathione S-transferase